MSVVGTLKDMLRDEEHGPYNFTKNGECSNCGNCCANYLPMSAHDAKIIKRYVEKHKIKMQQHNYPLAGASVDWTCPFRSDSEKKCLIYPVRPEICRSFKCDYTHEDLKKNKEWFHRKYYVVNMRETFFGAE